MVAERYGGGARDKAYPASAGCDLAYAGKTILSATFRVTMVHTYDSSARAVSLYQAPSAISSNTTWKNQPGGTGDWSSSLKQSTVSPTGKQSQCTTTNQNVAFDAVKAVRAAEESGKASTTFGIRADNEGDVRWVKRFCDNAVLSVTWNREPSIPKTSEMTTSPGGVCKSGTSRPFVDSTPKLYAVLRDPDHSSSNTEQVKAEFRVFWPAAAPTTSRIIPINSMKTSGSQFSVTAPADMPENVIIGWEVRASDGTVWGKWSSAGQSRCEFILDKTRPTAPDIDSPEYLPGDAGDTTSDCQGDDAEWRGSVGTYGTFSFDSSAADVKEYIYGFNTDPLPANKLTPTAPGGRVQVRLMPDNDGANWVTVQAIDQANRLSPISICHFRVATVNAYAQWALDDAPGSETAGDTSENGVGENAPGNPAAISGGVVLGVPGPGGRTDSAARFDGSAGSHLRTSAPALIDTARSFSVSAWVRLTDPTVDAVAVSQDGTGQSGFTLGYDAASSKWKFQIPTTDVRSFGAWSVSAGPVLIDEWTHLIATYDSETATISLYVNDGAVRASAPRRSAWRSYGHVQIGRALGRTGDARPWTGDIADVAVYRRLIVAREVVELYDLVPMRAAYWTMNEVSSEAATPEAVGGEALALSGNPQLYAPDLAEDPFAEPALVGDGHLQFDGTDDYAATTRPAAITNRSFTISMRVRLSGTGCGRDMAVVSQAGNQSSGFVVRCAAAGRWELALPTQDVANAPADVVGDDQALPGGGGSSGTHLGVVYNAFTNEMRLYVDGQLADSAVGRHEKAWNAAGGFQVARARHNGAWGQYFAGVIDDVRVYEGAADQTMIQRLAAPVEQDDL